MLTIKPIPTERMRNERTPLEGAPRCQTRWMLELTEDGNASVFSREYYGGDGTPMAEWHGRTLTWGFGAKGDGSVIDRKALETDLAEGGKLRALLERVHAGHTVAWNGQNHVGSLNQDADKASDEIERLMQSGEYADKVAPAVWNANDWITAYGDNSAASCLSDLGLTVDATDEQITKAVKRAEDMAADDDCELRDTEGAIRALIGKVREAEADSVEEG